MAPAGDIISPDVRTKGRRGDITDHREAKYR